MANNCENIIHPFQYAPGISQRNRALPALDAASAPVDGRTLADLLNYFVQMAPQINYYQYSGINQISDWRPFFENSLPFLLARISKLDTGQLQRDFEQYAQEVFQRPVKDTLQLLVDFFYFDVILPIAGWQQTFHGTGLPVERTVEALIQQQLRGPFAQFVQLTNGAVKLFCIRPLDLKALRDPGLWGIDPVLGALEWNASFSQAATAREKALLLLNTYRALLQPFIDAMGAIVQLAPTCIQESLQPLNEAYKQRHAPHLGLLFSFLYLFGHVQKQMNGFTQKHLDFFYKDVLGLRPRPVTPDKAHIVFELQQPFSKYLLKAGTLLRDGKDENKTDVLFELSDEIVVDNAAITSLRTLFLNPVTGVRRTAVGGVPPTCQSGDFIEGVYIAPQANSADGQGAALDPGASWYTAGARYSKLVPPGKTLPAQHPYACLGFVLASPVLLLQEGTRTITTKISCIAPDEGNCGKNNSNNAVLINDQFFFPAFKTMLSKSYYYFSDDLITQAQKMGIASAITDQMTALLTATDIAADGTHAVLESDNTTYTALLNQVRAFTPAVAQLFKPRKLLQVYFSGAKAWITPPELVAQSIEKTVAGYDITLTAILPPDVPAVTFYDKGVLNEDLNTTQPVMRVEVDQQIKINLDKILEQQPGHNCEQCCLEKEKKSTAAAIAIYHFLRDLRITDVNISVQVCGVKNVIVQNDETVQDVNGLMYPFGSRPTVGSNFYIGSEEIFMKHWEEVRLSLNWKDLPTGKFSDYYNGYQNVYRNANVTKGKVLDNNFKVRFGYLQDGDWIDEAAVNCKDDGSDTNNLLFRNKTAPPLCNGANKDLDYQFILTPNTFPTLADPKETFTYTGIKRMDASTRRGFLRATLQCQDFQHDKYPIALARQMMAVSKLPEIVDGAVYYGVNPGDTKLETLSIDDLTKVIKDSFTDADNVKHIVDPLVNQIFSEGSGGTITASIWSLLFNTIPPPLSGDDSKLKHGVDQLWQRLKDQADKIDQAKEKGVVIPKEPWTPIIKNLSVDYKASAGMKDMQLLHLYPFENTHKTEVLTLQPPLLPVYCEEGTLFIGLKQLQPYGNLQLLFQLAEATADSESEKADVNWYYLSSNIWKPLRTGFEILNDDTDGLTRSGIIKMTIPGDINTFNTIMPSDSYWVKAAIPAHAESVCETIGVHTQAVLAVCTVAPQNDTGRMSAALPAGSVSKLDAADAHIKSVLQPYDSFGGQLPEASGHFYVRISEQLRHKGRAIQSFDYERLVLEAFPQLYKVKCINHTLGLGAKEYQQDFTYAGGYVVLAVIPDLRQIKAGQLQEPKAPLSLLEKVHTYLKQRSSPFVRLKVTNPRYEKVQVNIAVTLVKGKDPAFYTAQLKTDLQEFFAPWAVGKLDKLSFGQLVNESDVVRFVEQLDYVDFVKCLQLWHELEDAPAQRIRPHTPRSILVSGNIDVSTDDCIAPQPNDHPEIDNEVDCNHPEPLLPPCTDDKIGQAPR